MVARSGMLALGLAAGLAGCGTIGLFGAYDVPQSADVSDQPWPRLADIPPAPAPGEYTAVAPDPVRGIAAEVGLGLAANEAIGRAEALGAPVVAEAERTRLTDAASTEGRDADLLDDPNNPDAPR